MDSRNSLQAGHLPPDGIEVAGSDGIQPFYHPVDKQTAQPYYAINQQGADYNPTDYGHHKESPSDHRATTFGMSKKAIFLCLLLTITVVVAVIGAAVGVSTVKSKSPAATATITATPATSSTSRPSSASTASATATSLAVSTSDCPAKNGTIYTSQFTTSDSVPVGAGLTFTLYCQIRFAHSNTANMFEVFVSSFDQCIEACASFNFFQGSRACQGAVFNAAGILPGNCWPLSGNGTGEMGPSTVDVELYYAWLI